MPRKRLTQLFPFLLPLRRWQRKKLFYLEMALDRNRYAKTHCAELLPHTVFESGAKMVNEHSGFPIAYQYNKVHNLRLAAKPLNHLIIRPGETFSFCRCTRYADRETPYKDGLVLQNGEITGAYGGGLCQLSNLLFWMFLHTPMTVTERHGHATEDFPSTTPELPLGTDATISEGWLDLKVKNNTHFTFQIEITFDETYMQGRILADEPQPYLYLIFNNSVIYFENRETIHRRASVDCRRIEKETNRTETLHLYTSECAIGYALPDETPIQKEKQDETA